MRKFDFAREGARNSRRLSDFLPHVEVRENLSVTPAHGLELLINVAGV